jgi:hypothetical protein
MIHYDQGGKLEKKSGIMIFLLLTASLLVIATQKMPTTQMARAAPALPNVVLTSNVTSLGPSNAINKTFTVNCTVQNISLLYGADIEIGWDNTTIQYVSHTVTMPVEEYPGGLLHSPTLPVEDVENSDPAPFGSNIALAAPGTNYWLSEASLAPAAPFNGTGTAFTMVFKVIKQPLGMTTHIKIGFTSVTLANESAGVISCTTSNCTITLYGAAQPAGPTIKISSVKYTGTIPYTFTTNVSIANLNSYWDLGGFDIRLSYDPQVMQAININVDPSKWFNASWPNGELVIKNQTDNVNGEVWVALLGLPGLNQTHTPLTGSAVLFTVTFSANASDPIVKITDPNSLAGFPHPQRSESPYNNSQLAVPIPFNVTNGLANIVAVTQHTPLAGYKVTTESNSSVSSILSFQTGVPMLSFNVTGPQGTTGFCNVTIPTNLMWSSIGNSGWIVQVDGQTITPTISTNANNTLTYIYFTYQQTTHYVTIISSNAVPEFGFIGLMILMMSALAVAVILIKKSPTLKKK